MNLTADTYESLTVEGRIKVSGLIGHIHHALKLEAGAIHNTGKVIDYDLVGMEFVIKFPTDEFTAG